jgi:hypothetical protein
MRKRLLLFLVCLVSVLLAGYVTLGLTAPGHRIAEKQIQAINIGMSEAEVETILGAQAGDYTSGQGEGLFMFNPRTAESPFFSGPDLVKRRGGKFWIGEEAAVWVQFDDAGQVVEILSGVVIPSGNESFLIKLRHWLRIQ